MADGTAADVVIIGGGVMGSASAFYLKRLGFTGTIAIVEQDTSYAYCSTGRSAGGLRQQFSTPENIAMSRVTLALIRELDAAARAQGKADSGLSFREQGYLILASESGRPVLAQNLETQKAAGADVVMLDAAGLASRFSWLTTDGLAAGTFGQSGEGWLDPVALMTHFRDSAVAAGVSVIKGKVEGIEAGDRAKAVRLSDGRRIACGSLVIAAGGASGKVAALAGIEVPVEPRKRYVYVLDCRDAPDALRKGPLTVDPTGVWFRPEGAKFICGVSPEEKDEPDPSELETIDHSVFEEQVWPVIAARVPVFEAVKVVSAWAGNYDYNTLDQNAIIGAIPEIPNMYVVTGFSGHGLQQSAAAGRAIAELITAGRFTTIDLTRFGYERIVRGEPLRELNVI